MSNEELESKPLPQLYELLEKTTMELLKLMTIRHADGVLIKEKRKEVQMIQAAIDKINSSS